MHRQTLLYWIVTGLMTAFMFIAAIFDLGRSKEAVAAFAHLGYPLYLMPFLGVAKIAGLAAIVLPSPGRVKEWAYAGLVFDLIGATYSHASMGDPASVWIVAVMALALVTASYLLVEGRQAPKERA